MVNSKSNKGPVTIQNITLHFLKQQILDLSKLKVFGDDSFMKMGISSPSGYKTRWEKEKLLFMSKFSFSHIVFKRLEMQTHKNRGFFGKGLKLGFRVRALSTLLNATI